MAEVHLGPAEESLDLARTELRLGNALATRVHSKQAIALSVRLGRPATLVRALLTDAKALLLQREFDASNHVIELAEAATDPDDGSVRAECLEIRGWWHCRVATWGSDHYDQSILAFKTAEQIFRQANDLPSVVRSLEGRAWAEAGLGNYPGALERLAEAVDISLSGGGHDRIHRLSLLTALVGKDYGYEEFGLLAFPAVIARCDAAGDKAALAQAMIGHASVYAHRAELDPERAGEAESLLRRVLEFTGPLGLHGLELEARTALIALLGRAHRPEEAEMERTRMEEAAERLPSRQILELLYREREQQTLFNGKLRRQVRRLQDTLESSEDAILVFDPWQAGNGDIDDFSCETGNDAAFRLLCARGNGVALLSELLAHPLLKAADRMFAKCLQSGQAQQDELVIELEGETSYFTRRVVPALPGVAICLRDATDRVRSELTAQDAIARSMEKSRVLEAQQLELLAANRRLDHLAMTDGLTGLLNHRAFQERLDEEVYRANREGTPLSLLMIDVDHFKSFNDEHGHLAGDRALRQVARALTEMGRDYDPIARYGGEEFAVILPGADAHGASSIAERMRLQVSNVGSDRYQLTVSIGVGTWGIAYPAKEDLIAAADKALFASKQAGRNRVSHADDLILGAATTQPGRRLSA